MKRTTIAAVALALPAVFAAGPALADGTTTATGPAALTATGAPTGGTMSTEAAARPRHGKWKVSRSGVQAWGTWAVSSQQTSINGYIKDTRSDGRHAGIFIRSKQSGKRDRVGYYYNPGGKGKTARLPHITSKNHGHLYIQACVFKGSRATTCGKAKKIF